MREELGFALELWAAQERERALAAIHSTIEAASFAEAQAQGRKLTVDEAVALALDSPG